MDDDKALKLLDHIGRELKLLWGQLEVWQELFDVEQEKRQTLIGTAPGFFAIVQVTLAESILMRVGRLMDPTKSSGQDNSSLSSLHDALPDGPNYSLRKTIKALTRAPRKTSFHESSFYKNQRLTELSLQKSEVFRGTHSRMVKAGY